MRIINVAEGNTLTVAGRFSDAEDASFEAFDEAVDSLVVASVMLD